LESQLAQVENFKQKQATISSQTQRDLPPPQANSTLPIDEDISSLVGSTDYIKAELQQIKDKFKTPQRNTPKATKKSQKFSAVQRQPIANNSKK
jgi:hypothetical protein